MSANAEDPESTIPWPGFVDILSTVIIVFVFFMMLTSVVIFVLSQQDKGKAVEQAKKEAVVEAATMTDAEKNTQVNQVLMENKVLKEQLAKMVQVKSVLTESQEQITSQTATSAGIQYGDFGVTLQQKTIDFLKQIPLKNKKILLVAVVPTGNNYGSTREIALNRALNVRNILLQQGVKPENIGLKITEASNQTSESDTYGNLTITYSQ